MGAGPLGHTGLSDGVLEGTLQDRLVQVMPASLAGEPVHIHPRGGEDPLPGPLPSGVRVFLREGVRQLDPSPAYAQVALALRLNGLQVLPEVTLDHFRKHRDAVLVTLPAADDDLVGGEVHVLNAKPAALEDP